MKKRRLGDWGGMPVLQTRTRKTACRANKKFNQTLVLKKNKSGWGDPLKGRKRGANSN